ncbi:hypothetical protein FB567DRAFT_526936 [Paraphoma chrysanthemicola]|uniref:PNPLA domain-containing protein n=1 Tax=Paraphoma chrysanthemicola TaxID=798071 RepID=A0A8K0R839_9PLEO|nr:hypothetical protein FB567DRAFT_526936 [Paraphoma chrysanthemicola]
MACHVAERAAKLLTTPSTLPSFLTLHLLSVLSGISPAMASTASDRCDVQGIGCVGNEGPAWYCVDCASSLCEPCWPQTLAHHVGRRGRDGPHEKVTKNVYKKLKDILEPCYSEDELEALHRRDFDTTWFGIQKDNNRQPHLADHDIYTSLLSSPLSTGKEKYPQLVSFIGQTNAGKSTLIKMLIELHDMDKSSNETTFPSPIVGLPPLSQQDGPRRVNQRPMEHRPTSAEVHLYADPERFNKRTPLLYADCEGLNGGENPPIGAPESRAQVLETESTMRLTPPRTRPVLWADAEKKRHRSFFVEQLYPRILYTLSDVVVFVMLDKTSKTFEMNTLQPLLLWAETSLETSINQPTLPHAIIALNSTDLTYAADVWDSELATQSLLEANNHCVDQHHGPHYFKRLAARWRKKGRSIENILDLIQCYYSTFKVIRIPQKGKYHLLHSQVRRLRGMLSTACRKSYDAKASANTLSKSQDLNVYFQSAFDHFARTLDDPFNFIKVSLLNNPIPADFGGHILQLAIAIQSQIESANAAWIFDNMVQLLASCIVLDCIQYRPGTGSPENLFAHYEKFGRYALDEFWHRYVPCEYRSGSGQCVNVAASHHPKGHQNANGRIIEDGDFVSTFRPDEYFPVWQERIKEAVRDIDSELQLAIRRADDESKILCSWNRHRTILAEFFRTVGSASQFSSHSSCFCCLMQTPQHVLRCGHVICTRCVKGYCRREGVTANVDSVLLLDYCPLHSKATRWETPFIVRFKPAHAGVRILCLDGGGMRGIVELEVLRAIQSEIGWKLPVRVFFDLIVGTSTGGIIALGFGVKDWSIKRCIDKFRRLCRTAFTLKVMRSLPLFKYIITLKLSSKYQTKPLRSALQRNFGDWPLFGSGGKTRRSYHSARVAVTATNEAGSKAIIMANYNRKNEGYTEQRPGEYEFLRPDRPEHELAIWQAAAATSAAPTYFKPFVHDATKRTYLDGAIYHNNPVRLAHREKKLIWPDVANTHPDIFLSIGTGQHKASRHRDTRRSDAKIDSPSGNYSADRGQNSKQRNRTFPKLRQIFTTMQNRIDSIFDAELAWSEFCRDVRSSPSSEVNDFRYFRLNPDVGYDPPHMDDVSKFGKLQQDTRKSLRSSDDRVQIARVAHVLVASSFFYETTEEPRLEPDTTYSCAGRICCRFEPGSPFLRGLGDYFKDQQTSSFIPQFEIETDFNPLHKVHVAMDVAAMREYASFRIETPRIRVLSLDSSVKISLHLCGRDVTTSKYHISGFPRAIMHDLRNDTSGHCLNNTSPESALPVGELAAAQNSSELEGRPRRTATFGRSVSDDSTRFEMQHEAQSNSDQRRRWSIGTSAQDTLRRNQLLEIRSSASSITTETQSKPTALGPNVTSSAPVELPGTTPSSSDRRARRPTQRASYPINSTSSTTTRRLQIPEPNRDTPDSTSSKQISRQERSTAASGKQVVGQQGVARSARDDQIRKKITSDLSALDDDVERECRQALQTRSHNLILHEAHGLAAHEKRQAIRPTTMPLLESRAQHVAPIYQDSRICERRESRHTLGSVESYPPLSHANMQRQRGSPDSSRSWTLPSLDYRLRSMHSDASMMSNDRSVGTSSTISTTPDRREDDLPLHRRVLRQQPRRMISTTFSDDDQSEISDVTASDLGRRAWEE